MLVGAYRGAYPQLMSLHLYFLAGLGAAQATSLEGYREAAGLLFLADLCAAAEVEEREEAFFAARDGTAAYNAYLAAELGVSRFFGGSFRTFLILRGHAWRENGDISSIADRWGEGSASAAVVAEGME